MTQKIASVREGLRQLAAATPFETSIFVKDLVSGDTFEHNAATRTPAASMIKLFILWTLFEAADAKKLSLDETYAYKESDRVEGGMLHMVRAGAELRLEDVALLMLAVSDNTAANILIDRLGIDTINAAIEKIGSKETVLGRKFMDFEAKKQGRDNFTSARDLVNVLERIQARGGRMLDMLSVQKNISKLPAKFPFEDADDLEAVIAHKTGELPGREHDAGILFHRSDTPVIVAALTGDIPNRLAGCAFCADAGKIVYDAFAPSKA